MSEIYDVVILGAGPAGLAAGLYGGRAGLRTLLIEKGQAGGLIVNTNEVENYPGQMVAGESGVQLARRMREQAEQFGAGFCTDLIRSVELEGPVKKLTGDRDEYLAKTVIVATGSRPRSIGCMNEGKFIGRGISFCATCDAFFFKDKEVYVVGGGDSAVEEALYLTKFARKVTLIHRRRELRAAQSIQERAFANEKLRFLWDTVVERVDGEERLDTLVVKNIKNGRRTTIDAPAEDGYFGLFGFVGYEPNAGLVAGHLKLDGGYIVTDADMRTSVPGVFAAGDIRAKSLRQVITAVADGAIAATQAERYINS